jgi:hypothetical protein
MREGDHYCVAPGCDHGSEPEHEPPAVVQELADADVEIARINASRDIKLAQISAGIASSELATEVAVAEAVAEAAEDKADAIVEVVSEPEGAAPVEVQVDAPEAVAEPEPESAPELPEAEHHGGHRKSSNWSWY